MHTMTRYSFIGIPKCSIMKKQIFTGVLLLSALFIKQAIAGDTKKYLQGIQAQGITAQQPDFENGIKINVTSLIFKTLSVQYERLIGDKTSVAIGLRLMPSSGLPFRSAIENAVNDDEDANKFISDAKVGGWAITPEFRYYFGKMAGRGFYLAPFLRYEHFNIRSTYQLTNDKDQLIPVGFKGSNSTLGIGFLIGSQFHLSDRITLDWWILGPYYTSNSLNLSAKGLDLSPEEQQNLKEALDGVEVVWLKLKSDVNAHDASLKAKGSFAAIRGFGLCLGFKF